MKISVLAKQLGMQISTIRYYEQLGLIFPQKNGYYKNYTEEHLVSLKLVQRLKDLGFTLLEIKELYQVDQVTAENLTKEEQARIKSLVMNVQARLTKKEEEILQAQKVLKRMLQKLEGLTNENR